MSQAIKGAAMLAGAVGMGVAAFFDPALIASPFYDKLMASLVLGGISMEAGALASSLMTHRGTGITTRQTAAYRQIVYGEQRVPGVIIYESTTGSHHDQYNYIIVLAGHVIDSIVNLYLDGRQVFWNVGSYGNTTRNGVNFGGSAGGGTKIGPGGAHYNFDTLVYCEARFGDQSDGDVMSSMTANDPNWAADGHGNSPWCGGCAYVYLKVEYDVAMFPQAPEIRFTVRGKNNIWDPRSSTYGYSSNWALVVADVLTDPVFGLGDVGAVNQAQLIAAANVCDEQVALAIGGTESRYSLHWHYDAAVAPGDVLLTMMPAAAGRLSRVGAEWFIWPAYWQGPSFSFDQSVFSGPVEWSPNRSFRELCNRVRGTYIAPNSPWNVAGNLYDANGWYNGSIANQFPFAFQPTNYPDYAQDVLHGYSNDQWLEEDSGVLGPWSAITTYSKDGAVTYSGVIYRSLLDGNLNNTPGAATGYEVNPPASITATPSTTGGSLAAGTYYYKVTALNGTGESTGSPEQSATTIGSTGSVALSWGAVPGATSYRVYRGTAAGAESVYFTTTTPSFTDTGAAGTAGTVPASNTTGAASWWLKWSNQLPLEVTQNCVLSIAQAQRCAKVYLLRNRYQGTGTLQMNLEAWQMQPTDVMQLTFLANGWAGKQLEVTQTKFAIEEQEHGQGENKILTRVVKFQVQVQETDQSVYEWSPSEELSVYDVPSNPTTAPYGVDPPSNLVLVSSNATALIGADGTVTPRILATWTAPPDSRVTQVQVQYQQAGAGSWTDDGAVDVATTSDYIGGVVVGQTYNVRIRSLANNGATSVWVETDGCVISAPNSQKNTYVMIPPFALTQPSATEIDLAACQVSFGGLPAVNYSARTFTIPTPPAGGTWYYVTIADPTQQGESAPTLTPTCQASDALAGVQGNTYLGAILALPGGGSTQALPGGWPPPQSFQVLP